MPTIDAGGVRLHYQEIGVGPPVVLMHGLGSSCDDWQHQVHALAGHYRVVSFDARGHGRSERPPGPWTLLDMAADAAALLGALELAPAHLVGVSMGAMVGIELAAREPTLVRSVAAINLPLDLRLHTFRHWRIYLQRRLLITLGGMPLVAQVLGRKLFPDPHQAELRRLFRQRWRRNDRWSYLKAMRALIAWDPTGRLEAIPCPVLLVAAEHDYWPPAARQAQIAALRHGELAVIPSSRHATPADQPEALNRVLLDFLGRVEGYAPAIV